MKKKLSLIVFAIILSHLTFADMAPMAIIPGGNLVPANNNDIQMKSEIITITLYPDYYFVQVDYVFLNHGDAQKVAMGFPSRENVSRRDELLPTDFKAYDEGVSLYIYPSEGSWDYKVNSKLFGVDNGALIIDQFLCCNVNFEKGEEKQIKNTYKAKYGSCHFNGHRYADTHWYLNYILKTGSLWKDSIESIQLVINTDNITDEFILEDSYFQDELYSLVNFDTTYFNVEPDFDFSFLVERRMKVIPENASSTLYPQGEYSYGIDNLIDGLSTTAWVEGVSGYGVGEHVKFRSNISAQWVQSKVLVDSIGIINGYAFDDTVFDQNSRVKKLRICTDYTTSYTSNEEDYDKFIKHAEYSCIIELEDSRDIQYFVFDPPLKVSGAVFTILDVYKGSKYADTAISEILFFVRQEYFKD